MSLKVFKDYRECFEEVEILVAGCSLGVEGVAAGRLLPEAREAVGNSVRISGWNEEGGRGIFGKILHKKC